MKQHLPSTATEAEKQKLREFTKKAKDKHTVERARAVLKRMEGLSREDIAQFLGINKDTVSNWITWYRKRGVEGLKSNWKGGNKYKLSPTQKAEIKQVIKTTTPREVGYGKDFWDVPLLSRYVYETYKVRYRSNRSYHRLFAFIGFTYHKPVKQDKKRNEQKVKEFEVNLRKKGELVRQILWSSSKTR